jgi:hypothetical protein
MRHRTIFEVDRERTGRYRLRVGRADTKGNVRATVSVSGSLDQARQLVVRAVGAWALCDEVDAKCRKGKR